MSTEQVPLGSWITAIVAHLAASEPGAFGRLLDVVGSRRARISLDDEAVVVAAVRGQLRILPADTEPVDGSGGTTRDVVLALLDGRLETSQALGEGLVHASGSVDSVSRIFHAIEIVLDVSARSPGLRTLAAQFRASGPAGGVVARRFRPPVGRELAVLGRLGLLPADEFGPYGGAGVGEQVDVGDGTRIGGEGEAHRAAEVEDADEQSHPPPERQ